MLNPQQTLQFSSYSFLYDMLVPRDTELRQLADLCDFSFIYKELECKYCLNNGRTAKDPIMMFKYLFLKMYADLSDRDIVKHSLYDLSYKYFLGLAPEETDLIDPSSLTKFRRQRLKDADLLLLLMSKTVAIAEANGIKLSGVLIVDSTHTESCYNMHKPIEVLRMRQKNLLHSIKGIDKDRYLSDMPKCDNPDNDLQKEVDHCVELIDYVRSNETLKMIAAVQERANILEENLEDLKTEGEIALDKDARIGHKSPTHTFNGYKEHLGLDKDTRLVVAASVTSGEVADGPLLEGLIDQAEAAGVDVKAAMGDTAYSSETNINLCKEKGIPLYSKLHPVISDGTRKDDKGFFFNKDSGLMVCPHGQQAIRKYEVTHIDKRRGKSYTNRSLVFHFDVNKCKTCPLREGCYKEGAKSKTYSVAIEKDAHKEQRAFQKTDEFKNEYRNRYQIEAKNGELKNCYGFDKAESYGQQSMLLQTAMTLFVSNLRRILRLRK